MKAQLPPNEAQRLAALQRYNLLDTLPEQGFDDLTALASYICGTPISLISLIDDDRQWFKSRHGIDIRQTPREYAMCAHTILNPDITLVIPDVTQDKRFLDNPFVTYEPHIRFYAGVPLVTSGGDALGTLCVIDHKPRELTEAQIEALNALGRQAMAQIESRLQTIELQKQAVLDQQNQALQRDNEDRLARAQAVAHLGYIDVNLKTGENFWSDEIYRILGEEPGDIEPSFDAMLKFIVSEERDAVQSAANALLRRQRGFEMENRIQRRNGEIRWVQAQASVITNSRDGLPRITIALLDITDRKQAQEQKSRLVALLEATTDFVGWADPKGRVQYINPAGRAMLGISPQEVVEGKSVAEFSPNWVYKLLMAEAFPTAVERGFWVGETAFLSRDGREIPVSRVITAHKDKAGQILYYSTIARDISESKKLQAVLERSKEELELHVAQRTVELAHINRDLQAQVIEKQMAVGALRHVVDMLELARNEANQAQSEAERANRAKSEFLSRMSHELRTPLNAILGFGQLLALSRLDETQNDRLTLMMNAGEHLLGLINEVLDIAHVESGALALSLETVHINEIVGETLALMQPLAQRRQITIFNETGADGRLVQADRQRLKQVLLNLLSNAIKYNDDGGRITLRSGTTAHSQHSISISNTGRGIAPEQMMRLFTPFERLGSEHYQIEGTGLGLALSKRLLEAMHGSIEVESQPLVETTFQIALPTPGGE